MVTQYFIQKNIINIEYWSATNKLKYFVENIPKKTSYNERKKLSNQITFNLVNKLFTSWEVYFKNHKKKDDLSDSLLQGLHYIIINNKSNIFNNADNLKLKVLFNS